MKTAIAIIALCLASLSVWAQKVEVVRMEVEKEIPGESFSNNKVSVDFWVQVENFASINVENTKLLVFEDDDGNSLWQAHKDAVTAFEEETERLAKEGRYRFSSRASSIINPEEWNALTDTLGFLAHIESQMITPSRQAKRLHVQMQVGYTTTAGNGSDKKEQFTIASLYENPTVTIGGKEVRLVSQSSMTFKDATYLFYAFPKNETPVAISEIKLLTKASNNYPENVAFNAQDHEFLIKEGDHKKPVTIEVAYKTTEEHTLMIDQWIDVGL